MKQEWTEREKKTVLVKLERVKRGICCETREQENTDSDGDRAEEKTLLRNLLDRENVWPQVKVFLYSFVS